MLRLVYIAGLFAITIVAGAGIVYCGWLMLGGDQNGLINLGKCLLVFLYGAYRVKSVLSGNYMIYRPWESGLARGMKRAAHGLLFLGILLFAAAVVTSVGLASRDYLLWVEMSLAIILCSLFALEITNAFSSPGKAKS